MFTVPSLPSVKSLVHHYKHSFPNSCNFLAPLSFLYSWLNHNLALNPNPYVQINEAGGKPSTLLISLVLNSWPIISSVQKSFLITLVHLSPTILSDYYIPFLQPPQSLPLFFSWCPFFLFYQENRSKLRRISIAFHTIPPNQPLSVPIHCLPTEGTSLLLFKASLSRHTTSHSLHCSRILPWQVSPISSASSPVNIQTGYDFSWVKKFFNSSLLLLPHI